MLNQVKTTQIFWKTNKFFYNRNNYKLFCCKMTRQKIYLKKNQLVAVMTGQHFEREKQQNVNSFNPVKNTKVFFSKFTHTYQLK